MEERILISPDNATQSGALAYELFQSVLLSDNAYDARQTSPEELNRVSALYQSDTQEAVQRFLFPRPELIPVLIRAHDLISAYFGDQPRVQLKLVRDPEIPAQPKLFAYIQTELPVDEAMDLANQLDNDWFDSQPASIDDLFMIALRFV